MRVYVLIEFDSTGPDKFKSTYEKIEAIKVANKEILQLDSTSGPYNAIMLLEGKDGESIYEFMKDKIIPFQGIRTTVCSVQS